MDAQLLIWLVGRYTKAGETILDPMFGSGTTMLACTLGRHVIGVELEQKFVDMAKANWEKVRQMPQLGYAMGKCSILLGDARNLEGLLVDAIITSPPYADTPISAQGADVSQGWNRAYQSYKKTGDYRAFQDQMSKQNKEAGYTSQIDAVITSPPYADGGQGMGAERHTERMVGTETGLGRGYSDNPSNLGNLKAASYLSAMLAVYKSAYQVLKPGGLLILITKNFLRQQKEIRLDSDTIALCELAGLTLLERHYRKLPALSFWRVIYRKKFPNAPVLDREDVLVFGK